MPESKIQKPVKTNLEIQDHFINRFKQLLPPGIGMAEEMADILNISIDSAYRRIRCQTELSIDEIYKLTKKYTISVDDVFSNQNNTVTFSYTKLTDSVNNFEEYLTRLCDHVKNIKKFENKKIYYVAEEMPMFYSFFTKKLTEFKLFYWQRSVLNIAKFQESKFEWGLVPKELVDIAYEGYQTYLSIPSVEIWTNETVLTGLRQIKFYFDSGIIRKEHALELLADYRQMIEAIQKKAETGRKNVSDKDTTFWLYSSEVVLGTNCIYILMGDSKYSYITFNTVNSLTTNNPQFCEETEHWVKNLERKSTLISGVSEKQRYRFFTQMFKTIDGFIENISKN